MVDRRESFESAYAASHDLPIETFSQYRMGDTYRLPGIASHWRTWCAALDSVEVKVPNLINCAEDMAVEFIKAIEAAGIRVA